MTYKLFIILKQYNDKIKLIYLSDILCVITLHLHLTQCERYESEYQLKNK